MPIIVELEYRARRIRIPRDAGHSARSAIVRNFSSSFATGASPLFIRRIPLMKKLLLATVLALGATDAAYASLTVPQWYEGVYRCTLRGSSDTFYASVRLNQVWDTDCDGDTCRGRYKTVLNTSGKLSSWSRSHSGEYVYRTDRVISFHLPSNPRTYVEISRGSYLSFGKYVQNGRSWAMTCRHY
jgi:hypothetical protein